MINLTSFARQSSLMETKEEPLDVVLVGDSWATVQTIPSNFRQRVGASLCRNGDETSCFCHLSTQFIIRITSYYHLIGDMGYFISGYLCKTALETLDMIGNKNFVNFMSFLRQAQDRSERRLRSEASYLPLGHRDASLRGLRSA